MSYKIHPKEFESVFSLESRQRYQHFVSKVCDWEELWILENEEENFLIVCPEADIEYFPVWPHPDYASAFGSDDYPNYKPSKIELEKFIETWLPGLDKDGIKVGAMPNLETTVWIIDPNNLKVDLKEELKAYE